MATGTKKHQDEPIVVKKYANRRLYDTSRSSYVTLDDLYEMVKEGYDFIVYDAKTGEDLTRSVLTQIIVDQESSGQNMLPVGFLRRLIGYYDDGMRALLPNYLEHAIDSFATNQETFRQQVNKSIEGMFPVNAVEELNRRNLEMFEKALTAFNPFYPATGDESNRGAVEKKMSDIKSNINELQKELDRLGKKLK